MGLYFLFLYIKQLINEIPYNSLKKSQHVYLLGFSKNKNFNPSGVLLVAIEIDIDQ